KGGTETVETPAEVAAPEEPPPAPQIQEEAALLKALSELTAGTAADLGRRAGIRDPNFATLILDRLVDGGEALRVLSVAQRTRSRSVESLDSEQDSVPVPVPRTGNGNVNPEP